MKKTACLLALPLVALLGFFAWHLPMRGPLTDAEIDTFLANQAAGGGLGWTDTAAFEAFLREDDGHPFVMINLIELRDVAMYPEGLASEARAGTDAATAYGRAVLPLLLKRGSYPLARALRSQTIINSLGQSAGAFETLVMVRYRSRRDLIDMLASDAFRAAAVHKWASLDNTLVAPARALPSFQLIAYLPLILLCFSALVGLALFRKG